VASKYVFHSSTRITWSSLIFNQVAVKIVPRGSADDGHNQSRADRERADHSKEVRTAREAAIVTLLDHPYICAMRDVCELRIMVYAF